MRIHECFGCGLVGPHISGEECLWMPGFNYTDWWCPACIVHDLTGDNVPYCGEE